MRRMLWLLLAVPLLALFWKELPALRRYIKIERM
jgi:hypothetical protein